VPFLMIFEVMGVPSNERKPPLTCSDGLEMNAVNGGAMPR